MYIHISLQKIRERKAMTEKISYIQINLHQLQGIAEFRTSVWSFHVPQSKVNAILYTAFWPMKYCSMLSKTSHSLYRMQLLWFMKKSTLSRLKFVFLKTDIIGTCQNIVWSQNYFSYFGTKSAFFSSSPVECCATERGIFSQCALTVPILRSPRQNIGTWLSLS